MSEKDPLDEIGGKWPLGDLGRILAELENKAPADTMRLRRMAATYRIPYAASSSLPPSVLRDIEGFKISHATLLEQAAAELDVSRKIVAAALAWRAVELKAEADERERCDCGAMQHDPPTSHEPFDCAWVKSGGPARVEEALEHLREAIDTAEGKAR